MENVVNALVLAGLGDYVAWWQWVLLLVLVVLIVVFVKIRNKQM